MNWSRLAWSIGLWLLGAVMGAVIGVYIERYMNRDAIDEGAAGQALIPMFLRCPPKDSQEAQARVDAYLSAMRRAQITPKLSAYTTTFTYAR